MEDLNERLENPNFQRWIKCAMVLKVARTALLEIVENVIRSFHCDVSQKIPKGQNCSRCNKDSVAFCKRNVCSKIRDEVMQHNRIETIPFHNINISRWQQCHWEIAKCFILARGYRSTNSARETDFTGIISIIINFCGFQKHVNSDLDSDDNIFRKVKEVRNRLMHNAQYELSEKDLKANCDLIISMLRDFKTIDTVKTVSKISEIQQATVFDPFIVRQILQEAAEALEKMKLGLDEQIRNARSLIEEITEDGVAKIQAVVDRNVRGMDDKFRETRVKFQEICRKILLDIVTTHIENERPKYASFWNHKTFLHYIRNREGMKMMLPHHKEILYPKDGEPALVSEWDLSLLTFIMLIPCRRNANEEALDIINKLKVMRDSILENKETQVEILEHLIAHAPQTLKAKMLQIIERDFSLIAREEPQQDILKNWQTNDMKINLQGLSQDKEALRRRVQLLEERFNRLVDDVRLRPASTEIYRRINVTEHRTYPIVKVEHLPQDKHADLARLISPGTHPETFSSRLNEVIAPSHVESIGVGCIILEITCPSVKSLFAFWDQCLSGEVFSVFESIKDTCRERLQCDSLEFEILLTEAEMERCFNSIEYQLEVDKQIGDHAFEKQAITSLSDEVKDGDSQNGDQEDMIQSQDKLLKMATSEEDMNAKGCDDSELATQIVKILNHTSESLDASELLSFLSYVDKLGKEQMTEDQKKDVISICTKNMLFKEGMTVDLIKQTVRSLIAIHNDKKLHAKVWKNISRLAGPLNFSFLAEFGQLDDATLSKYMDLLQYGTESVRHIRLMVVGMFGVGKTTVIGRLCKKDMTAVKSTVGIDVSVDACEVDDQKQWKIRDLKTQPEKRFKERMSCAYHQRANTKKVSSDQAQEVIATPTAKNPSILEEPANANPSPIIREDPIHENTDTIDRQDSRQRPQIKKVKEISKNPEPWTKQFFHGDMKDALIEDFQVEHEKRLTTVSIWDFAGQSIYYSTHHFFLSARAIYLLVLDISRPLSDVVSEDDPISGAYNKTTSMPRGFTCLDAFKFWMNSIYTYTTARADPTLKEYVPTIVLVGTFKDKVKEMYPVQSMQSEFLEQYKNHYFDEALLSLTGSEVLEFVHKTKFFVSRYDPDDIFDVLKRDITNIAEKQPFWNEIIPMRWMPLERSIERRKDEAISKETGNPDDKCIMEFSQIEEMDQDTEYPLSDRKLIKSFLNFQHALGNVLYYDTEHLEDNIILDPQWIIDAFKLFVNHVNEKHATKLEEWRNFKDYAILTQHLIDELIQQDGEQSFQKYKEKIVHYMEYLDVFAKPVNYKSTLDENSSSEEDDDEENAQNERWPNLQEEQFYIVPCLLSQGLPDEMRAKIFNTTKMTPTLCLVFKNNFLPAFVCHRLIATCIRKWEVDLYNRRRILFREFVRFKLDDTNNKFELWWKDHILYLRIIRYSREGMLVNKVLCTKVRQQIQKMIKQIFSIHRKFSGTDGMINSLQYDEYIKCPQCHKDGEASGDILSDTCMLKVEWFKQAEEINCDQNHTILRDEALACWFYKENHKHQMEIIKKSRADVFKCLDDIPVENEIEESQCAELSKGIGKEYIALGIELGLTFERIEQIEMEEPVIRTRVKTILVEWRKSCPEQTVAVFRSAFEKITGFRFKSRVDREKEIVKWYEKIENPNDSPDERNLIEVIHVVGRRYKRLAKKLFEKNMDATIKQIEMQYSFDFNRTLAILLMWMKEAEKNVTFAFLKKCLVDTFKMDWELTEKIIAKDKEEEARKAVERKYIEYKSHRHSYERKGYRDYENRERSIVEEMGGNRDSCMREESQYSMHRQVHVQTFEEETDSSREDSD